MDRKTREQGSGPSRLGAGLRLGRLPILAAVLLGFISLSGSGLALGAEVVDAPAEQGASTTGETVAFYILAAAVAGAALGCVIASNIVRMAVCLLGTLGGVALLYFLMAANFLGAIQLVVYAGGTLIVIVFGVMLTSRAAGVRLRPRRVELLIGAVVCVGLFIGLATILVRAAWETAPPSAAVPTVATLGQQLLTTYLVPFEVVSVLLLAVMIGAAYLAQPVAKGVRLEPQLRRSPREANPPRSSVTDSAGGST